MGLSGKLEKIGSLIENNHTCVRFYNLSREYFDINREESSKTEKWTIIINLSNCLSASKGPRLVSDW